MDKKTLGYWALTGLLSAAFTYGSISNLFAWDHQIEIVIKTLHYPMHLLTILGIAKALAVAVLLLPGLGRLKEWAYAGVMIDLFGAFLSHVLVHPQDIEYVLAPLPFMVIAMGSYFLRPASRRI